MGFFTKLFGGEGPEEELADEVGDDSGQTETSPAPQAALAPPPKRPAPPSTGSGPASTGRSRGPEGVRQAGKPAPPSVAKLRPPPPRVIDKAASVSASKAPRVSGRPSIDWSPGTSASGDLRPKTPSQATNELDRQVAKLPSFADKARSASKRGAAKASLRSSGRNKPDKRKAETGSRSVPEPPSFEAVARQESSSLREFLIALSLGPVNGERSKGAQGAMARLKEAAEREKRAQVVAALDKLQTALSQADSSEGFAVRAVLGDLSSCLPGQGKLQQDVEKREALLVENLVRQLPSIHNPDLDKLKAAGLWSLPALGSMQPERVADTTGLEVSALREIRERAKAYLEQRRDMYPSYESETFQRELGNLISALEDYDKAFVEADANEDREGKRNCREARREAALKLNVLLVESGDLEALAEAERMSVAQRVEYLRERAANQQGVDRAAARRN